MRRVLLIIPVLAAAAALVVAGTGADDGVSEKPKYWIEFDNAFGLVEGGDVKIAGVRAGKIKKMELNERNYRALIQIEVTQGGFGDLRTDVFCESRPQSLIGEYFVDCRPGKSRTKLREGATIPVDQTGTTVPADLVASIWRRPYRERFTILLNEFGAALAGRGLDLNETIRRANPALRETDRVLAQLAEQRDIIQRLYRDADRVVTTLADNRGDIQRWVDEAEDLTAIQADESESLRAQFQRLPTFLTELRPTAELLGQVSREQTPVLLNLNRNAGRLEDFFNALGPFARASRPAVRSLAEVARTGEPTVEAGTPIIQQLSRSVRDFPEAGRNLALALEHLDDPSHAVERDTRAPNGRGYSGLQAVLRYVHAQTQAVNLFDRNNYLLKVAPFVDPVCSRYHDAQTVRAPNVRRCSAALGPNQPGINQPDPTAPSGGGGETPGQTTGRDAGADPAAASDAALAALTPTPQPQTDRRAPERGAAPRDDRRGEPIPDDVLDGAAALPGIGAPQAGQRSADGAGSGAVSTAILDYLVGP